MASQFLIGFENYLGVGSTRAAAALGIAYSTYAAYRSLSRELPPYHVKHVHSLMAHDKDKLKMLLEKDRGN